MEKLSLKEALEYLVWVKTSERRSQWTIRDYKSRVGVFIRFLEREGVQYVEDVQPSHVRSFIEQLDKQGLEDVSINIYVRYIRAFFNLLKDDEMADNVPMKGVKMRKEDIDSVQPIPKEILTKLLSQPDKRRFLGRRNYVCMIIMLGTGIRPSELLQLHVDDWREFHIIVRGAVAKNGSERILPLSSGIVKEMYKYIRMRGYWGGKLLFPNQEGKQLTTSGLYQALRKYAKKAGVEVSYVTPYAFRHTFAITYLKNGGDVFKLQKLLGHSNLEMTRRYVQWSQKDLLEGFNEVSPAEEFLEKRERRRRKH